MTRRPPGAAVRAARESQGVSLRALARQLEISPATLSAVENDHTPMTTDRLHRIAQLLDVPAAHLLRGEAPDPPTPEPEQRDWRRYDDLTLGPILDASVRLFVRRGFHATSMREVATEAGVSVAGIYHHYTSKQQILVALMDVTMTELRWRVAAARDEGATPVDGFALMVESLALFHVVRGDLAFLGASEMRGLEGADHARVRGLRNDLQHMLDDQAALVLPGAEVRAACRAIATMCTSLPSWFSPDGPMTAAEVARAYADYAIAIIQSQK